MKMERDKLPFRINCEGYFFNKDGKILAKESDLGFIMFPGGGVNNNEPLPQAMLRETKEETGAIITNLKKIGVIHIIWGENWAKSDKQKKRYSQFKGDEMHFFTGVIDSFERTETLEEDFWDGSKIMDIEEVMNNIEKEIKNSNQNNENLNYRKTQLKLLKELIQNGK